MTILIVDDDSSEVARLRQIVESFGHETVSCGTGVEALELARRHRPELAIIDTELPDFPGLLVQRYLRLNPDTRDLVVFLAHPRAVDEDVFFAWQHGSAANGQRPLDELWLRTFVGRVSPQPPPVDPRRERTPVDEHWDAEWERLGHPLQPSPEDEIAAGLLRRKGLKLL